MANRASTLMFQMLRELQTWLDVLCFTAALHSKHTKQLLLLIFTVSFLFCTFNGTINVSFSVTTVQFDETWKE